MRRRPIHLLEVGLVWPPETFLQWKLQGLAERGFRVTVGGTPSPGERRTRLAGLRLQHQPHWRQSKLAVLWGIVRHGLALALMHPARLRGTLEAARTPLMEPRWKDRWHTPNRLRQYLPLARLRPDVVQVEWNTAAVAYLPMARVWNCPVVVACRGSDVGIRAYTVDGIRWGESLKRSFERADAVHCVSEDLIAQSAKFGLDPGKAFLITTAVDPDFFSPGTEPPRFRGELRIVSVGDFRWLKGHEQSLQTLRHLLDAGVAARLKILGGDPHGAVGEGSDRARLEHTIETLALGERVDLPGSVSSEEVRDALRGADVYLHSSLSEGIPTAVVEAMACERPVVTSDCGGVREALTDGVDGLVVPLREPRQAAAALESLWADPERARGMGRAGRRRVLSDFTLEEQLDRFVELYERVVAGAPPRSGSNGQVRPPAARPETGEPSTVSLRILSVAPLSWKSGYDYALHAVRLLIDRGIDCEYRILGEGGYADAVSFARHQLGLEAHALVVSPDQARPGPLLDWADVLLDAAVTDDASPALDEAADAGLRIVSTRDLPRRDSHALADALARLAEPMAV